MIVNSGFLRGLFNNGQNLQLYGCCGDLGVITQDDIETEMARRGILIYEVPPVASPIPEVPATPVVVVTEPGPFPEIPYMPTIPRELLPELPPEWIPPEMPELPPEVTIAPAPMPPGVEVPVVPGVPPAVPEEKKKIPKWLWIGGIAAVALVMFYGTEKPIETIPEGAEL